MPNYVIILPSSGQKQTDTDNHTALKPYFGFVKIGGQNIITSNSTHFFFILSDVIHPLF